MEGRIRFYNLEKHYGVVENEGGSWFFPGDATIGDAVTKGDCVQFDLADDERRPGEVLAINVQKVAVANDAAVPDPCRLCFSNVGFSITEPELVDAFGECGHGVISLELIRDSQTKVSRGFGFVQMADARSALAAIARYHARDLFGRRISVKVAETPKRQVARRA
jgi:cold-inducible RNA-binding protein